MESLGTVKDWPAASAAAVVLARRDRFGRAGPASVAPTTDPRVAPIEGGAGAILTIGTHGDTRSVFAWASITKLCTALAVAVAVEEGTVSLQDEAGPPGSTVAHLLSHASGLGPSAGPPVMAPGRRRIYSNHGYEVLGNHLSARSGLSFVQYANEAVLEPLAMVTARWDPAGSPASGLLGSVDDLAALARELMWPTLVAPVTLARMTAVAFAGLDGVLPGFGVQRPCDWGLGPEVRGRKRPHWTGDHNDPTTFGHFGQAGGFLWVDPAAGVALGALSDQPFGAWAADAWPTLSDAVLSEMA
jgi:CubicO group peptidase (beta-lactamase class C family)